MALLIALCDVTVSVVLITLGDVIVKVTSLTWKC